METVCIKWYKMYLLTIAPYIYCLGQPAAPLSNTLLMKMKIIFQPCKCCITPYYPQLVTLYSINVEYLRVWAAPTLSLVNVAPLYNNVMLLNWLAYTDRLFCLLKALLSFSLNTWVGSYFKLSLIQTAILSVMAHHREPFGVQCLAQGHINTPTAEMSQTNPPIRGQVILPVETWPTTPC